MRTAYEVLHRPRHDDQAADIYGQYPTIEEARAAAGHPDAGSWQVARDGGEYLSETEAAYWDRKMLWAIYPRQVPDTDTERVELALDIAIRYGQIDGDHHKLWVIDQIVRMLAGDRYEQEITEACDGEDGPNTYSWDVGIAP